MKHSLAIVVQCGAWIVSLICAVAMFGYQAHIPMFSAWFGETHMAIPTAISLFILSICVWIIGHLLRGKNGHHG